MSNMSYCRFENTLSDFADCIDHMDETKYQPSGDATETEKKARLRMIRKCVEVALDYGHEIDMPVVMEDDV